MPVMPVMAVIAGMTVVRPNHYGWRSDVNAGNRVNGSNHAAGEGGGCDDH
jgi:hypothetical protein